MGEGLQPGSEPGLGPPDALGHRPDPASPAGQQGDDAVGLAQVLGSQHDPSSRYRLTRPFSRLAGRRPRQDGRRGAALASPHRAACRARGRPAGGVSLAGPGSPRTARRASTRSPCWGRRRPSTVARRSCIHVRGGLGVAALRTARARRSRAPGPRSRSSPARRRTRRTARCRSLIWRATPSTPHLHDERVLGLHRRRGVVVRGRLRPPAGTRPEKISHICAGVTSPPSASVRAWTSRRTRSASAAAGPAGDRPS